MKKLLFAVFAIAVFCLVPAVLKSIEVPDNMIDEESSRVYTITDASQAIAFYEDVLNQPEWKIIISRRQRGEMLQLPEELLTGMTTEALLDAVIEYPFFIDIFAHDNPQWGMETLYETFNGFQELSSRPDAADALLREYESEPVKMKSSDEHDILRMDYIEILLTQDYILRQLDDEEITYLSELCYEKYSEKCRSECYNTYSAPFFYNLIGADVNSADLIAETESKLRSYADAKRTSDK